MTDRSTPCERRVRLERLHKAEEFWQVGQETVERAENRSDVADAAATMFVHSGIASADVICCARLKRFSRGEDHRQAVALLREADAGSAGDLAALLDLKTKAAYSHVRVSATELTRASRAAEHLLSTARRLGSF